MELRKLAFVAIVTTFIMATKLQKSCFAHCIHDSDLRFVAFIKLELLTILLLKCRHCTPEPCFLIFLILQKCVVAYIVFYERNSRSQQSLVNFHPTWHFVSTALAFLFLFYQYSPLNINNTTPEEHPFFSIR